MEMENISEQKPFPQNLTQPPSPIIPPQQSASRKRGLWLLLLLSILAIVALGAILGRDFLLNSLLNKQTASLAVLYSINKGRLQDHNYDTLVAESSETYISDINRQNSQPVSIGYNYIDIVGKANTFKYQTTEDGKYLIRSSNEKIEISPAGNPTEFTTLFTPTNTKQFSYFIISQDNTKLIVEDGGRIAIVELTNPSNIIYVLPPESGPTLIGYDVSRNQLYLHPYILTIDDKGNILNSKEIKEYDFITEFTKDFQYAFFEDYDLDYKNSIVKYNLQTGEKTTLVDSPGSPVHLKLSPTEDKLFFIDNTVTHVNYLYIVDLVSNKTDRIAINAGIVPSINNYISPDGKYLQLYNSLSCASGTCADDIDHILLLDVEQKKFFVLHQPLGVKEAFQDDYNAIHSIETMDFLGWLVKETYDKPTSITLPLFDLQAALATPTPNPVSSGDYPLMQIDLSKSKEFTIASKYPDEILNANPANLVGMKCSPRLSCDPPYDSCWYFDRTTLTADKITETTPQLISLVKEAAQSINSTKPADQLANVVYCQTEAADAILAYQALGSADRSIGVANGTDYVGFAAANGTFKKVATIETQSDAHGCDSPIMLTKEFNFYLTCNAFEGPSIQKIDLKNVTQQKLFSCSRDTYACQ